jgi:hypothetical protein
MDTRRQARQVNSPEKIQEILAFKRQKQLRQILKLKKTRYYRVLNIFCIICVLIYCELIFCMFGPARYRQEHCVKAVADEFRGMNGKRRIIHFMSVYTENDRQYKFMVDEAIQLPLPNSVCYIGKDFLLNKEIKIMISTSVSEYRLWRVVPLVFLGFVVTLVTLLVFVYNMNLENYSLIAVSVLNAINLLYFVVV